MAGPRLQSIYVSSYTVVYNTDTLGPCLWHHFVCVQERDPTTNIPVPAQDNLLGLLLLLAGSHVAKEYSLKGQTIGLPSAQQWDETPLWPYQSDALDACMSDDSDESPPALFSLRSVAERGGGVVLPLRGAGTRLQDGTLHLPSHTALVLDDTCSDVVFSNLTFSGAPFSSFCVCSTISL